MLPAVAEESDDDEPLPFSQQAQVNKHPDAFVMHQRDGSSHVQLDNTTAQLEHMVPAARSTRKHGKLVNDAIHGLFRIAPDAVAIIDTPEFQRLRELKQLGLSSYVYPAASHTRFEHSLGTYHLAERWAQHFQLCQPDLGVTNKEVKLVAIAGLCHDLGHGPFSHLFDNEVLPRLRELGRIDAHREWSHEAMSCEMLQHLYDVNDMEDTIGVDTRDGLQRDDLRAVKELISIDKKDYDSSGQYTGAHSKRPQLSLGGKMFLYEIVANGRNSVDIDKFDYLLRDGAACNVRTSFDHSRLIQLSKVINGRVCFKTSEVNTLYNLFHTRANMHQVVYTHAKAKAIEYMVTDALVAADAHFRFQELIWEPRTFKTLDDTILKRIEWSAEPELEAARAIVRRLRVRDLYKYAGEANVPDHMHPSWSRVTARDIVDLAPLGSGLREEDVIVDNKEINYSMKSKDPVRNVEFFEHLDSVVAQPLDPLRNVSSMLPRHFQDKKVRVFVRDASKLGVAMEALNSFAKSRKCASPIGNTPVKRARCAAADGGSQESPIAAARGDWG